MSRKALFYYSVAAVATFLAFLLWLVVFSELRDSRSPSREVSPLGADVAASPVAPGRLPVVPVLRAARDGMTAGDPVHAALHRQLQGGRAVCLGGYYAMKAGDGTPYLVHTSDGLVPCP